MMVAFRPVCCYGIQTYDSLVPFRYPSAFGSPDFLYSQLNKNVTSPSSFLVFIFQIDVRPEACQLPSDELQKELKTASGPGEVTGKMNQVFFTHGSVLFFFH